ncbi:hypothetical protein [Luteimonas sp. MC1828]|uniref:hypothetical protein n=1 Tax=Luteimonas sp. MC1828 TaxID=2799787 RepID=UPI0018F19CFF|nr:hypothetical protein [Luteimonas sp. MC1828]MBJ7575613.1 hypothetical protein [Luteimonas sp. MC1828]
MSITGPDSRLNVASSLHRIDSPLDDLRRQQGGDAHEVQGTVPSAEADVARAPLADAGEYMLNAPAWESGDDRMLAGDLALESSLGGMPLAQAAEHAVDAVLDAFA